MKSWISTVTLLLGLQCITTTLCLPHSFRQQSNFQSSDVDSSLPNNVYEARGTGAATATENIDMDRYISGLKANTEQIEEQKLLQMGNYLAEMLMLPQNGKGLPLVYIDEDTDDIEENAVGDDDDYPELNLSPKKRSRYYRKYPWKRQNSRENIKPKDRSRYTRRFPWKRQTPAENYDSENRYLCQPSRDDVFRLLVAIHDTRQAGSNGHNINFCNRKRPAKAIFTHIRFLG